MRKRKTQNSQQACQLEKLTFRSRVTLMKRVNLDEAANPNVYHLGKGRVHLPVVESAIADVVTLQCCGFLEMRNNAMEKKTIKRNSPNYVHKLLFVMGESLYTALAS